MEVLSKIKSTSGAEFAQVPTVKGEALALQKDVDALKNAIYVTSVGSLFKEGASQYEGYRIKIVSDTQGNVKEVITGHFDADGSWVDDTGIQAGIIGMPWNGTSSDIEFVQWEDGTMYNKNTFDDEKIAPWSDIKYVTIEEHLTTGRTITQHMAACPKFYYTGVNIPANTAVVDGETISEKAFIQIVSSVPLKSFDVFGVTVPDAVVYEEFVKADGTEMDWVYDPVYAPNVIKASDGTRVTSSQASSLWGGQSTIPESLSGCYVLVSEPEDGYPASGKATSVIARGMHEVIEGRTERNYTGATWQQFYRNKLLYRIEFNTLNTQAVMNQQVNGSIQKPSCVKALIEVSQAADIPYSGFIGSVNPGESCWSVPAVYRYHVNVFGTPGQVLGNVVQKASENSESGQSLFFGFCRTCTFVWGGYEDETTQFGDYAQYYEEREISSSAKSGGWVTEESWYEDGEHGLNGIITIPEVADGNGSSTDGYGDYAYFQTLNASGSGRFAAPVVGYYYGCSGAGGSDVVSNYYGFAGDSQGLSGGLSLHL